MPAGHICKEKRPGLEGLFSLMEYDRGRTCDQDSQCSNNISEPCRSTNEPIFVTRNGYGEMVVMSMETYEEQLRRLEFYQELAISEKQFDEGKYKEAKTALFDLRDK